MILEELELKSFRGYRSPTTFRFAEGLNLLIGPNEGGKSTLFEAISRALFDRHTSRSAELRRVQPLGSSLGPEVRLVVRHQGKRYRVVKRFLDDPRSELWVERDGRFELDHEGDRADRLLRRLLRGDEPRGKSRPIQRGLAQALWYLQREDPIPAKAWSEALREGLRGLLKVSLSSAEQDAVLRRVEAEYRQIYTATGRLSAKSELAKLRRELPEVESELEQRREEVARAENYRQELQRLERRQRRLETEREAAQQALGELERSLQQSESLAERRSSLEDGVRQARRELLGLQERSSRLSKLQERAGTLRQRVAEAEAREADLRVKVREQRRTAERHARRWEDDLAPRLEAVRAQVAELRSKLRIDQLEREVAELDGRLRRRRQLEGRLQSLDGELEEHAGPSEDELSETRQLASRSSTLFERAQAAAARVGFQLEEGVELEARPETPQDPASGEFLVTRPTIFRIGGAGTMRVQSGDEQTLRLDLEARECARQVEQALERYGVDDVCGLAQLRAKRRELEERRSETASRLAELDNSGPPEAEEERLLQARRELTDLQRRSPQAVLPGMEGWAEGRTLEQIWELEEQQGRLERQLREEREGEHRAQQSCLQHNEELVKVSRRSEKSRAELESLRREMDQATRSLGSEAALEQAAAAAAEQAERAAAELDAFLVELEERVERPRRERAERLQRLAELDGELGALGRERADRLARIEEVAALSLDARIGNLEGRHAALEQRLAVLERRAAATRLVRDLLTHLQNRQAEELQRPVAALVNRWLAELTGREYAELLLDESLLPKGVHSERYDQALPLSSLSYGTYEQVVVLLRLAIGVLLSREERQLVILDDRLVNADEERMTRLCRILQEAAEQCQILVASCRQAPYASLEAKTLRIGGHTGRFPRLVREAD